MPHHKIVAACLVLFFAALTHPALAQNARPGDCPPECQVRRSTGEYFTLLKAQDWDALSQLGLQARDSYTIPQSGTNLSLRLLEQLLGKLKIEALTYTVSVVSAGPDEARVHYSLRLRATDPSSKKTAINVSGARRVLEWERGFCNCPETGMRAWMLKRDTFEAAGVTRAYLRARTASERQLVLIGLEKSALEESSGVLQQQGLDLINSGDYRGAFDILSLAQNIHDEIRYQGRLSSQLDGEDSERQIREASGAQNRPALAALLKSAASSYAELKENDKARSYLEASLRLFKEVNDVVPVAKVHKELAELHIEGGDYLGAVPDLERSMRQYLAVAAAGGKLDDSATSDLTDVVGGLFLIYELQGRDEDAARVIRDAQHVLPDEYKAMFIFGQGLFRLLRGQGPPAFDNYEKAFELLNSVPRTKGGEVEAGLAGVSLFLSLAHSSQGDHTKAAANLQRARKVILDWRLTDEEMAEFGDMPQMFVKLMEAVFYGTTSADSVFESRLKKLMPRIADASEPSQVRPRLGEVDVPQMLYLASIDYLGREEFEHSRHCLLQALALAESSDDTTLLARLHQHLAFYYSVQNNNARVIEHLNTSLRLSEELRGPVEVVMIGRLMAGANLLMLASTYEETENYAEARRNYQKVQEFLGPFTLFNYAIHKAIANTYYAEAKYNETIKELDKGISLARKVGLRYFLWEMYQLSGRAHWWKNDLALARRDLEAAVAEIEAMRRTVVGGEVVLQRFFEDKLSPYHDLVELLLQQGDCDGALAYAERSKSRVLQDVLKRGRKFTRGFMSSEEQVQEASLRRKLIALNRRVEEETHRESRPGQLDAARGARAEARLDYELFRANFYAVHPELAMRAEVGQELTGVEGLSDLLPSADIALLEYVVTGYSTYLFVVTAEAEARPLTAGGGASSLRRMCRAYRLELEGGLLEDHINDFRVRVAHPEGVLRRQARDLYDKLLKPAEQHIQEKKTLVIVPDGILWELPFQALQPRDDRYLLQDSVIYYAPSFTALQEMKKARNARAAGAPGQPPQPGEDSAAQPQKSLTLLALGDPSFSRAYETLRGTGILAKKMETLYGKTNSRVYTGATADEELFKSEAGNYQVIHIGTHGVLDDDNPLYSYVMLSQGEPDGEMAAESSPEHTVLDFSEDMDKDGVLEAWELMDLELRAQLVVLSACETARGRVGDGEGIVGLSWSLFIAGSPATVVSQWKVDEKSTNELMFSFHENFARRGGPPQTAGNASEALQKAAFKLMESTEYRHPYYWAGFVLIGDGS